ncbi:MAG: indole-3-glycerol phosphate synthase TrpC [Magnetococcus sp. WYHC-3]
MSVLKEICERKAEHVRERKAVTPEPELIQIIKEQPKPRGFASRLEEVAESGQPALITEVKKASPSKGIIREDFDPVAIAKAYERAGAACVSVLTDAPYFQGSDSDFRAVRAAISLPMIRKDFMISPYQIYESRAMGADCVLLIMAALDDSLAHGLHTLASELRMDVLVEVHDAEELQRAVQLRPKMIGVNNRNLKTLAVDVQTSLDLGLRIPPSALKIAESGISDSATIERLQTVGYAGFLIGESLMRQSDIERGVSELLGNKSKTI